MKYCKSVDKLKTNTNLSLGVDDGSRAPGHLLFPMRNKSTCPLVKMANCHSDNGQPAYFAVSTHFSSELYIDRIQLTIRL